MTTNTITLVATGPGGVARASVVVQVADPPVEGEYLFQEDVPSSYDISLLVPANVDRITGGFYSRDNKVYSDDSHIPGVTIPQGTKKLDYDGSLLSSSGAFTNPNTSYYVGWETPPYNDHWQYPPRTINIPQPSGNPSTIRAINGGSKHTRARFCPWDPSIYIVGGDYGSVGLINDLHQDGRMLIWRFEPVANTWDLLYPALGRTGEEQPLSPDIMGPSMDEDRQLTWISWGDARAGVTGETRATGVANWRDLGGLSDVWPKSAIGGSITDAPIFTFDAKNGGKYTRCCFQPWNIITPKMREAAYDRATKRLYKLEPVGTGVRVHWLDTTTYEVDPKAMPWFQVDIDLSAGKPNNLTGSGAHQFAVGYSESPCHIDEQARLLYFLDSRTPAVLAVTLFGHPQGAHKVKLIANLPGAADLSKSPMGLLGCASLPFIWIPEHRKILTWMEPLWEMVGPLTSSFEIDVDTGQVSDGIRFPNLANGKPWFPGAGCWYPPSQEVIVWGYYPNTSLPYLTPQTMHAYKYTPGGNPAPYRNAWTWLQLPQVRMNPKPVGSEAPAQPEEQAALLTEPTEAPPHKPKPEDER